MITLEELKERLMQLDETLLIERLELTSEDIVNRFSDLIENNYQDLAGEFDEDTPWDND
jgi:hypothetical protein